MNDVKMISFDRPSVQPKKKLILFENFKKSKGTWLRHRLRELRRDFKNAIYRMLYGYEPTAVFAVDSVFIERYIEILTQFKGGYSHPSHMSYEEWQEKIDKMITLLKFMEQDEYEYAKELGNGKYDWDAVDAFKVEKEKAKNEFFEIFSLYFFDLWD